MLEKEITPQSLESIKRALKDGEEPTELLFSLVSSPLMTLKDRGVAQVYEAKDEKGDPVVLAIFAGGTWDPDLGIIPGVLAVSPSVGSPGEVLAVEQEEG